MESHSKYRKILPAVIFFMALALRFVYFSQIKSDFFFRTPTLDSRYYDEWAREIVATGDWLSKQRGLFVISPGYAYFLAVVYKAFGRDISAVALIQFLLGSLSCVFVFLVARKMSPDGPHIPPLRRAEIGLSNSAGRQDQDGACEEPGRNRKGGNIAAVIAGLLSAAYGMSIFYEGILVKAALINFLNVLLLYFLIVGKEKNKRLYFLLGGLCLGFSVHLRPNILAFIVFLLAFLVMEDKDKGMASAAPASSNKGADLLRRGNRGAAIVGSSGALLLGVLVVVLPVVARNYLIGHQFVLTTAHGGMNLYTGNNAYSLGPYTPLPFAYPNPYAEIRGFHAEAERRAGHSLSGGEADRFWYEESWNFIRERPAQWLALMGKKVLIFFNNYEDSINLNYYVFREESKSLLSLSLIAYGIVFPLGLWGMIVCGWKNSASRLLSSYVIFYFLASVAFFVVSEYRYPVVPVLAIFAGQGAYWFFQNGNVRRRALKVFGMIFIFFMFWLSRKDIYKDWFGLHSYEEAGLANAYYSMGTVYAYEKKLEKAGEFYEKSIKIQPQTGALVELGDLYASQGEVQKAKQMLEYAVRMDPLDPKCAKAYKDLGLISLSAGNSEEAERYFRQAELLRSRTLK